MRSISFRLTIWYAAAAAVTAAAFMFFGRFLLENNYVSGVDDLNNKEWEEIGPRIRSTAPGDLKAASEAILHHTEIDASLYFFQLEREDGSVFFTSSNLGDHHFDFAEDEPKNFTRMSEEVGEVRVGRYSANGYRVYIATSLQAWENLNSQLVHLAGVVLLLVFLASLGIGYFISRVALRPIANIEKTANRIGVGNLSERIKIPNTRDEVARLTVFLNDLLDRLELAVMQAQRFAADASHELKTPLSLVRLRAESLLLGADVLTEKGKQELEEQLHDIERLAKVIDDMLLLAKSEAGVLKLNIIEHSTQHFLEDFSEDAATLCEDSGVTFVMEERALKHVAFDEVWMRHVLFNLLSNSLRCSESGSLVRLNSSIEGACWVIRFEDEGPGVAASKLQKIFDRFYSENASEHSEGVGLGLAFCRSIVAQHRGQIVAENRTDRSGLRIVISLPH